MYVMLERDRGRDRGRKGRAPTRMYACQHCARMHYTRTNTHALHAHKHTNA